MLAELRTWDTGDFPPGRNAPEDPEDFEVLIQAAIAPPDQPGGEWFDFLVCTPAWLAKEAVAESYLWGRHRIIVPRWDLNLVLGAIQDLCASAPGPDWATTSAYLSRFGMWEYERFRHAPMREAPSGS
jgi:hypothetical protein